MELTPEILKDALRRYDEIEMSKVPNKEDLHFEYSRRFERKMRRLIRKVDTPARYRLQQVASIALVLATILGTYVVAATDAGAQFRGWIREQYESLVHYFYEGEPSTEAAPEGVGYRLSWLPEGYTERAVHEMRTRTSVTYDGQDGNTIYFWYQSGSENRNLFFEPESYDDMRYVHIGTKIGELYESEDPEISPILLWDNEEDSIVCSISAFLSENELVKMAENVEKIYLN